MVLVFAVREDGQRVAWISCDLSLYCFVQFWFVSLVKEFVSMSKKPFRKAFTLIELLVVIAIIAVLIAL